MSEKTRVPLSTKTMACRTLVSSEVKINNRYGNAALPGGQ